MFILSLWLLCSFMQQQQQQCVKSHLFEPVQETVQIHQAANSNKQFILYSTLANLQLRWDMKQSSLTSGTVPDTVTLLYTGTSSQAVNPHAM